MRPLVSNLPVALIALLLASAGCADDPPDQPPTPTAICGNGQVEEGEECDPGATSTADCGPDCQVPGRCGDGDVDPDEECDDGPDNAEAGACLPTCVEVRCGDGFLHDGVEECDDGPDNADSNACTAACARNVCGDGLRFDGVEACDRPSDWCVDCAIEPREIVLGAGDATFLAGVEGRNIAEQMVAARGPGGIEHLYVLGSSWVSGQSGPRSVAFRFDGPVSGTLTMDDASTSYVVDPGVRVGSASRVRLALTDIDGDGVDEVGLGSEVADFDGGGTWWVEPQQSGTVDLNASAIADFAGPSVTESGLVWSAGDLSGDGQPDVIVRSGSRFYLVPGPLSGGVSPADSVATIQGPAEPMFPRNHLVTDVDVTGDGQVDLVLVSAHDGDGKVFVFEGPLSGAMTTSSATATVLPSPGAELTGQADALGDADGDGATDLLIVESEAGTETGHIVPGPLVGTLQADTAARASITRTWVPGAFFTENIAAAGDVDGDGRVDVMVSEGAPGLPYRIYVLLGPFAGELVYSDEAALTIDTDFPGNFITIGHVGDVDNDGRADIFAADSDHFEALGQGSGRAVLLRGSTMFP